MRLPRLIATPLLTALALPLAFGCGGGGANDDGRVIIQGKLVKGGAPYALDPSKIKLPKGATALPPGVSGSSMLQVTFISSESKEQFTANTNPEAGTFTVSGVDGKGIKPGRYKIAINARVGFSPSDPDLFDNKFSAEKTQILRDVKAGEDVVIDIDKPQG